MLPRSLRVLLSVLLLAFALAAQGFDLGKRGGKVVLGDGWKRQKLNEDLGDDQFLCKQRTGLFASNEAIVVVLELPMLVENEDDCDQVMPTLPESLRGRWKVTPGKGMTTATREAEATEAGIKFVYRFDLLSRAGLTYVVMAWGRRAEAAFLRQKVAEFVAAMQFPPAGSGFARDAAPATETLRVDDQELTYAHRPSVLPGQPLAESILVNCASEDQRHLLQVYTVERSTVERALDIMSTTVSHSDPDFHEVRREDFVVSGVKGRRLIARNKDLTYHLLALPIGEGRFLDIRYISAGAPELAREDRDLFFSSLQLQRVRSVLQLPEANEPVAEVLPPRLAAILQQSRVLATVAASATRIARQADGRWLLSSYQGAVLVAADGSSESVIEAEGYTNYTVVQWNGRWLCADANGVVCAVARGELQAPEPFTAAAMAVCGDDLLLARAVPSKPLPGGRRNEQEFLLLRRTRDGQEQRVAELHGLQVTGVVTSATSALVVGMRLPAPWSKSYALRTVLVQVDLGSGVQQELDSWQAVSTTASAEGGFLVTGQPPQRPAGIYLLRSATECVPILTGGDLLGVACGDGRLVFARSRYGERKVHTELRELVLGDQAMAAALCQPFTATLLERIGAAMIASKDCRAPRTAAEIQQAIAVGNAVSRELVGVALPATTAEVDGLFEAVMGNSHELGTAGRTVLAVASVAASLQAGAEWIDSDEAAWSQWWSCAPEVEDNAFAIVHQPGNLLRGCLDDSEGGGTPGSVLFEFNGGRTVLLGLAPERLRERAASCVPKGLQAALEAADADAIALQLEVLAGNHHARGLIYDHLIARDKVATAAAVARHFAEGKQAKEVDLETWLGIEVRGVSDPKAAQAMVEKLTAAVQRFPRAASLVLCLGVAYEQAKPGEPEYAATCYRRVLALASYGTVAEAAKDAMKRLGK